MNGTGKGLVYGGGDGQCWQEDGKGGRRVRCTLPSPQVYAMTGVVFAWSRQELCLAAGAGGETSDCHDTTCMRSGSRYTIEMHNYNAKSWFRPCLAISFLWRDAAFRDAPMGWRTCAYER